MESILYSGTKSFTDLLPNGDKVSSEYFANPIKGGAEYLIDPMSDANGNTTGFLIYENNGDKDLALRQQQGTVVTVEQAKAGNWNPATNKVDTNQTFTIQSDGNVTSTPVTTTPPSNEGTGNTTPSTPGIDNSGNTNNGASSGGTSGVNDNNLFIDMNRIDQFQSSVNSSYNKMDRIYDSIIASLNKLGKADTSNGDITDNVKDAIQTCKNKKTYAESKRKKTINAIKSDKEAIERQQLADDLSSANTLEEVKKVMLAYLQGGEN